MTINGRAGAFFASGAACRHLKVVFFLTMALGASIAVLPNPTAQAGVLREIADTYAGSAVANGQTVGVGVAIIVGDKDTKFFTYGNAVYGVASARFTPDSLFRIGSTTKVFTTNLLGQRVLTKNLDLHQPLSDFQAQTGTLPPLTSKVNLKQLATFTGGINDFPPECSPPPRPPEPGCLPVRYPTLRQYPVQDFLAFFQNSLPTNYNVDPPKPVKYLPVQYFYSNYSVALIGLLLGGAPGAPLDDEAVRGWFREVKQNILKPLDMHRTYLFVPRSEDSRKVAGYNQALARPTVQNGAIKGITVIGPGAGYSSAPRVQIIGGGGSGATATATLSGSQVSAVNVKQTGGGYIAPPQVQFSSFIDPISQPIAEAVISDGKVVGVFVHDPGSGLEEVPQVTISGGLSPGGQPAQLTAEVANGRLKFVNVVNPGSGYVQPLSVVIAPSDPTKFPITASAPSGFLHSTLRDMAKFARAAMEQRVNHPIPHVIKEGFKIAQHSYVCQTSIRPGLANCPPGALQGGLAWSIEPADVTAGMPRVVAKDGGVPGYSTYVTLMHGRKLAVVVFVNSVPVIPGQEPAPAALFASNILNALFYRCFNPGGIGCQ